MTPVEAALEKVRALREAERKMTPTLLDLLKALLVYIQFDWDDPRKEAEQMRAALAAFVEAEDGK